MTGRGSNLCFDLVNKISDWHDYLYRADALASGSDVRPSFGTVSTGGEF